MRLAVYRFTEFFSLIVGMALTASALSHGTIEQQIADAAAIEKSTFEDTKKARNDALNQVFREFLRDKGGDVTADVVREFNALLKRRSLTNFDDFLAAETTPLRYREDPRSRGRVPVLGPLGSDVINSWLADLDVVPGKRLPEQPIYRLATNALREHLDFALIGLRDPNLSLERLPPRLRENAQTAYRRLNPTNQFAGGFDHPLYYATLREAAKKLFREDFPHLKLNMADIVAPEAEGGFGIRSCLLCHDHNHTGVYQRLLGQGLYLDARAGELSREGNKAAHARAEAQNFLRAAETVRQTHPDKVDVEAARRALAGLDGDNLPRLRPGFPDFCATLKKLHCLKCHSNEGQPPADKNPRDYGAYVLQLNGYSQTANIKALLRMVNTKDLAKSKLLLKATAMVDHEGAADVKLDAAGKEELRVALARWLQSSYRLPSPTPPTPPKE